MDFIFSNTGVKSISFDVWGILQLNNGGVCSVYFEAFAMNHGGEQHISYP